MGDSARGFSLKMKIIRISMLIMAVALLLSGTISSSFGFDPSFIDILEGYLWTIQIDGSVDNPANFTLNELVAMPAVKVPAVLFCYNTLVAAGVWTGPRLSLLLEKVEFDNNTASVKFYAKDGYSIALSITQAMEEDVIIAYAIDDQPLPELRLVVPGQNGNLWIALITHIEASLDSFVGPPLLEPSPSPTPAPSPSPPAESPNTKSFPIGWIVSVMGTTAVVGAILIVYKKKVQSRP